MRRLSMQKCIALLLTLSLFFIPFSSIGSANMDRPMDPMGYEPWLSLYHNATLSGFSDTYLRHPLDKEFDYPLEINDTRQYQLSLGMAVYDKRAYFQSSSNEDHEKHELMIYDLEGAWLEEIVEVPGGDVTGMSPVIMPELNRIYLTSLPVTEEEDPSTHRTYLSALDLTSLEVLWTIECDGIALGSPQYDQQALYLKGTKIDVYTENDILYYGYSASLLYKIDAIAGEVLWTQDLPFSFMDASSQVTVFEDRLFISGHNYRTRAARRSLLYRAPVFIQCLHAENGEIIWEKTFEDFERSGNVSTDGERVYAVLNYGRNTDSYQMMCIALDAETGSKQWEYNDTGFLAAGITPKMNHDTIFFATNVGHVFAINKQDGAIKWRQQYRDDGVFINFRCRGTALTEDYLFLSGNYLIDIGTGGAIVIVSRSVVCMLNIENGRIVWRDQLEEETFTWSHLAVYGKGIVMLDSRWNKLHYYVSSLPKLSVQPEHIALGEIEHGVVIEKTINIRNTGRAGLEGVVEVSDPEWMSIEPTHIDDSTTTISLTINTENLTLGDHKGTVAIRSNGGNRCLPVTMNVVKNDPPEIFINKDDLTVIENAYYTRFSKYTLQGTTEANAQLWIMDEPVGIDEQGNFQQELHLQEGLNKIELRAIDWAENVREKTFELNLDSKPPVIIMTTPNYKLCVDPNELLMGQVDDVHASVYINETPISLAPNGTFAHQVTLTQGINEFHIKAMDRVGNVSERYHYMVYPEKKIIILYIGKTNAEINGMPVTLDVPPRIMNGRTMIPLRFVGEAMGAEIEWEGTEQKITFTLYGKEIILRVGANTALVNGEPVALDTPPTIIDGRTLVPVRFVSENLGARVDWQGDLQRITITFPAV